MNRVSTRWDGYLKDLTFIYNVLFVETTIYRVSKTTGKGFICPNSQDKPSENLSSIH